MCQTLQLSYYRNYLIDCNQILKSDRGHQLRFVSGPNMPPKVKKSTKIDNKTANITTKKQQFVHNVNSDGSKTANIIKSDITQHHIDI